MSRRNAAPAQIIVFKKKAKAAPASLPETPTVIMEEVVIETAPQEKSKQQPKKRRSRSRETMPRTVTPTAPDTAGELLALGHRLFEKGKVHESKKVFEGLALSLPNDAFIQTMLGAVCLSLSELPKAHEHFEKALTLDPGDIAARVYRGELRLHRRKLRSAVEDFDYAIAHGAANDPFVERARRLLKMARKQVRR